MSYETRLWQEITRAANNVTDSTTGRFESKHLTDEIANLLHSEQLAPEVREVSVEMQAKTLAREFVEKRNPKPTKKQGILFHPEAILPLGQGIRVWMKDATAADLMTWGQLSAKNLHKVARAESARQEYVASRVEVMRDHQDWRLERVERDVFEYQLIEASPAVSEDMPNLDEWDQD